MSRKNRISPYRLINGVDLVADETSQITCIEGIDNIALSVSWTSLAGADGSISVEVSSYDPIQTDFTPVWHELDFADTIQLSGNSGSHSINITNEAFYFLRVKFNYGTQAIDTLVVTVSGKAA